MVCSILERFGGYTYGTLMEEDCTLLQLLHIERLGRPEKEEDGLHGL